MMTFAGGGGLGVGLLFLMMIFAGGGGLGVLSCWTMTYLSPFRLRLPVYRAPLQSCVFSPSCPARRVLALTSTVDMSACAAAYD